MINKRLIYLGGGGAYILNEVSTCGGLIYGRGLIFGGGAYIRRFTVFSLMPDNFTLQG